MEYSSYIRSAARDEDVKAELRRRMHDRPSQTGAWRSFIGSKNLANYPQVAISDDIDDFDVPQLSMSPSRALSASHCRR